MEFNYEALNKQGLPVSGKVNAENQAEAQERLREAGVVVTKIEQVRTNTKKKKGKKVPLSDMSLFSRQLAAMLDQELATFTADQCAQYYDEIMIFSESTYDENLLAMGFVNLDSPATINIYASSFENKDIITAAIEDYNNDVDELKKISYTDYLGIMMSSITIIINAIT